eukprot:CAMPEP_0119081832 /NCGR_PEP_ID=MMETSP1178-20130426/118579_1 /TAXON_ID=33656 /ORGANISM="unid sp, Strain CCMP2000" /LENGTH=52 /DNA_ID=CAMNT_0007064563 /DNA_START=210 /DNA_END=365 /DNA_ORIENTATION=+
MSTAVGIATSWNTVLMALQSCAKRGTVAMGRYRRSAHPKQQCVSPSFLMALT